MAVVTGTTLKPSASAEVRASAPGASTGHSPAMAAAPGAGTQCLPVSPALPSSTSAEAQGWGPLDLGGGSRGGQAAELSRAQPSRGGDASPGLGTKHGHQHGMAVAPDALTRPHVSYLLASTVAGLALAGIGGAGAILLLGRTLADSIFTGAGSSGERRQDWVWTGAECTTRHGRARAGQEALPAGELRLQHRGSAPGTGVLSRSLSPSLPPSPDQNSPGCSPSSPASSFAVLPAAGEQRGSSGAGGRTPRYSPSPRDPSAGQDSHPPALPGHGLQGPSLAPHVPSPSRAQGRVWGTGVLSRRCPQVYAVGDRVPRCAWACGSHQQRLARLPGPSAMLSSINQPHGSSAPRTMCPGRCLLVHGSPTRSPAPIPAPGPAPSPAAVGASSACGGAGSCKPPPERRYHGTGRMPSRRRLRCSSIPLPPRPGVPPGWLPPSRAGYRASGHRRVPTDHPVLTVGNPVPVAGRAVPVAGHRVPMVGQQPWCRLVPAATSTALATVTSQAPKMPVGFIHPKRWPQPHGPRGRGHPAPRVRGAAPWAPGLHRSQWCRTGGAQSCPVSCQPLHLLSSSPGSRGTGTAPGAPRPHTGAATGMVPGHRTPPQATAAPSYLPAWGCPQGRGVRCRAGLPQLPRPRTAHVTPEEMGSALGRKSKRRAARCGSMLHPCAPQGSSRTPTQPCPRLPLSTSGWPRPCTPTLC